MNLLKKNSLKDILFIFWLYTLLVILWGAWVRISHSGDGCGNHWPLCGGTLVPTENLQKTWIEYFHRMMSGLYGIFVIILYFKIKKMKFSKWTHRLNLALFFLMISEALLGAILVKKELVTMNDSILRLIVMSFHQLNSFVLTGVTFLLYYFIKHENSLMQDAKSHDSKIQQQHWLLILFLILPITGAIAALSTTLFPTISLWQGIAEDFQHNSHLFIRLRVLHPAFALITTTTFISWCFYNGRSRLGGEFLIALAVGVITLLTLSPTALKLTHLLIAHLLWARVLQLWASLPDSSKR